LKPAAIICAGGAYMGVNLVHEGIETAQSLDNLGYATFVLYYRTAPNTYPEPQKDLALAIKYIRANADSYGINPDDILVTGYSAGGHLAASEALYAEEIESELMNDLESDYPELAAKYAGISVKPNKLSLNYPLINMTNEDFTGSVQAHTGGDESLYEKLSIELHAGPDFPKTFIWANDDDTEVNPISNAAALAQRLEEQGVEVKYCTYPSGGHGVALGLGTSCEGWIETMVAWMNE